jgi:hypothetical protein
MSSSKNKATFDKVLNKLVGPNSAQLNRIGAKPREKK